MDVGNRSQKGAPITNTEKTLKKDLSRQFQSDSAGREGFVAFLEACAIASGAKSVDYYLRAGELSEQQKLSELGSIFLRTALGFLEEEFLPFVGKKQGPSFVPQSEDYYPWAFYALPTTCSDLREVFDKKGREYLLSDSAGKKNYAVLCNFKELIVCDLNHEQDKYTVDLSLLFDTLVNNHQSKQALKNLKAWESFRSDFGPESSEEKKKKRRTDVAQFTKPAESNLAFVKRFGHMPNFELPIGWDGDNFRQTFKTEPLPFLDSELVEMPGANTKEKPNRLIWGDNLAILRAMPDCSVDLIYIDPPFFSGRDYNCIFGDDAEVRSFSDIWDGGLPTYLAWLNARLWEMKRVLKETGSIFVHLDWHACHYVKCEMDKVFGYDNFKNDVCWIYAGKGLKNVKKHFARNQGRILFYSKRENVKLNLKDGKISESVQKRFGGSVKIFVSGSI